jgi:tRNA pseudouridine38-40 synthase
MKTKYAIRLAYDGTDFCGWQTQNSIGDKANPKPSIEETLVAAILDLSGEVVTVSGSGRTDAGVHASGQIAHFRLETLRFSEDRLLLGLNHRLPGSVRIVALGKTADHFHAGRAIAKQYSYYFQVGSAHVPHLQRYATWCRDPLDGVVMHEAARALIGIHDFEPFASGGSAVKSTVREVFEAEITRERSACAGAFGSEGQIVWRFRIRGSGFLRQMVRRLAGTLRQIGEGRRPGDDLATLLNGGDCGGVGPAAPAGGLWLERVWYGEPFGLAEDQDPGQS